MILDAWVKLTGMETKLTVTGSREAKSKEDQQFVYDTLKRETDKLRALGELTIFVGDCPSGVDAVTSDFATDNRITCIVHEAAWEQYGRAAGPIRNKSLMERATRVFAFPKSGAKNRGTTNAVNQAKKKGIPVEVFEIP